MLAPLGNRWGWGCVSHCLGRVANGRAGVRERTAGAGGPAYGVIGSGGAAALALLLAGALPVLGASKDAKVFTIGNYPVEARAVDAVTAKERAIADGQKAAFRSLLKRLVPVTAYNRLAALKAVNAAELIEGVAVRSERNSSTEYIASYDFAFQADAVRRLLDNE